MNEKDHAELAARVKLATMKLQVLMFRSQLGNAVASKELERALKLLIGKEQRAAQARSSADRLATELFEKYEEALPVARALKRRIRFVGAVAGSNLDYVEDDLRETGADKLAGIIGPWTSERFNRLRKKKPSDWLYEEWVSPRI